MSRMREEVLQVWNFQFWPADKNTKDNGRWFLFESFLLIISCSSDKSPVGHGDERAVDNGQEDQGGPGQVSLDNPHVRPGLVRFPNSLAFGRVGWGTWLEEYLRLQVIELRRSPVLLWRTFQKGAGRLGGLLKRFINISRRSSYVMPCSTLFCASISRELKLKFTFWNTSVRVILWYNPRANLMIRRTSKEILSKSLNLI